MQFFLLRHNQTYHKAVDNIPKKADIPFLFYFCLTSEVVIPIGYGQFFILAPLFGWSSPRYLDFIMGGPVRITVDADLNGFMEGSFDGMISYTAEGGYQKDERWIGPGSVTVVTDGNSVQDPSISFHSHGPTPLQLRVRWRMGGAPRQNTLQPLDASGINALQQSDAYWNKWHPNYQETNDIVTNWFKVNY